MISRFSKRSLAGSVSLLLRLASLAGKLALSLYMARFFALAELGRYGLAFGAVMLAIVGFGFRLDYVLSRDIMGFDRDRSRIVATSVSLLFLISFLIVAPVAMAGLWRFGDSGGNLGFLALIYLLCCVESYSNFLYTITTALKRPALANALFFVRSGLWTIPAIVLSFLRPELRTVDFVLLCWLGGAGLSVLLNLWWLRDSLIGWPGWRGLAWAELHASVRRSALVWVGSLAITLGVYVDRFILASYLTLDDVGVATFYTSFTTAALTLVQSATTNVTFPALIEHYDGGDLVGFRKEFRRTAIAALLLAGLILAGLAVAMFLLGKVLGKPELGVAFPAFLLLLAAAWVRTHAETLYYALFVERLDRPIWLGNLLFLAASLGFNLLFIPVYGLNGLGISALLSAIAILGWRWLYAAAGGRALHKATTT